MRFSDALKKDDPADEIFNAAMSVVFDEGDEVTEHIDRLSGEARLVYLLWCLDGELHNGGFDQLFTNSLGNHCLEILAYLEAIGATNAHSLLARAISWFPDSSPSPDRAERSSQHASFADTPEYEAEIDRLDAEFYEYKDNLASLVNSYVAQHPHASVGA